MASMTKTAVFLATLALGGGLAADVAAQSGVSARASYERAVLAEREAALGATSARLSAHAEGLAARELALEAQLAGFGGRESRVSAPEPWLQQDPGSQQYSRAREALNARRYQDAAEGFAELRRRYPASGYVASSLYYEAFARSRLGGRGHLNEALELLRRQMDDFPDADTRSDARELMVRVEAQLASRGDAAATARIAEQASAPCGEQQAVRAAALSALLNMNAERAIPILQEVLKSRDECSAELRRQAVFLISQKMSDESVDILLDLAHRNPDPDQGVREQAVFWLSQVKSEEALTALESILMESRDREIQEKAIFAISQHRSERAMQLLRDFTRRDGAPTELRANAIFWIGQNPRAGGTEYLIELYPSLRDAEVKERTVFAIAQGKSEVSRRWLLERARDRSESLDVRQDALFWAGQTGGLRVADLRDVYDSMTEAEMKERLIFVASQKNEPEAVDFLMDVARTEPDSELKERAIFWLGQSKDPRVGEFLLSLIRG